TLRIGPKSVRHDAVRAKHDYEALLPTLLVGKSEAGQIEQKRHRGRTDPHVADEFASGNPGFHSISPDHGFAGRTAGRSWAAAAALGCAPGSNRAASATMFNTSFRTLYWLSANERRKESSFRGPKARTGCFTMK